MYVPALPGIKHKTKKKKPALIEFVLADASFTAT